MSPECDFFNGADGLKCHRVRALKAVRNELGLEPGDLKEIAPLICKNEDDSERALDCPAFRELSQFGPNTDFAIRTNRQ